MQEKLEEIKSNEEPSFETIKSFKITESIFNEAMRLYPPVSFLPREASNTMSLRDKPIEKGDMVTVSPWLLHRNQNYWDNPHDFDPERFHQDDDKSKDAVRSCFIPFGKATYLLAALQNKKRLLFCRILLKILQLRLIQIIKLNSLVV